MQAGASPSSGLQTSPQRGGVKRTGSTEIGWIAGERAAALDRRHAARGLRQRGEERSRST